jgi:hypothetical protein
MGNSIGTATGTGVDTVPTLKLLLIVLPLVSKLSETLADQTSKQDRRYDFLVNIRTSTGILLAYLENIEADGQTASFATQISQLADCLEDVFSRRVIIHGFHVGVARFEDMRIATNGQSRHSSTRASILSRRSLLCQMIGNPIRNPYLTLGLWRICIPGTNWNAIWRD